MFLMTQPAGISDVVRVDATHGLSSNASVSETPGGEFATFVCPLDIFRFVVCSLQFSISLPTQRAYRLSSGTSGVALH